MSRGVRHPTAPNGGCARFYQQLDGAEPRREYSLGMAVVQHAAAQRFEVREEPGAYLLYEESAGRLRLIHTEVPARFRGRGWASDLARFALDYARERQLRVDPQCPFVQRYLRQHPEYTALVDPSHHHPAAEERRIRDAALDETIEASFPASDPASSDPNPDDDEALR